MNWVMIFKEFNNKLNEEKNFVFVRFDKCQKIYVKYIIRNCPDGLGELALLSWRFGRDSGELVAGSGKLAVGSGEMVSGEMAEWRNDL